MKIERVSPTGRGSWIALLLLACSGLPWNARDARGQDHGHDHGHGHGHGEGRSAVVTVWTKRVEVFMEHPFVVAGEPAAFVTHVTNLADYSARRKGSVTFVMTRGTQTIEHADPAPKRPGIYIPDLTFPSAGSWSLRLRVPLDDGTHEVDLGAVEVYANHDAADAAPDPEEAEGISFLKEQQWVMPFRVEPASSRKIAGADMPVIPETAIVSTGETSYVFVQLGGETFELRKITIRDRDKMQVVVESGLKAGEHVVTKGTGSVALSMEARPDLAAPAEIVSPTPEQIRRFGIETQRVGPRDLDAWLEMPGEITIKADGICHVVPKVAGTVRSVHAKLGDVVEAGQLLAVLESRDLADAKAAFLAADQRLNLARTIHEREAILYKKKVTSEQDYLAARQAEAEARIALRTARHRLLTYGLAEADLKSLGEQPEERFMEYRVTANCGGTVIRWHLHNGELVDEKTETIEISDLTKVWVDLSVNESRIDTIRTGQPVEILFSGATPKARAAVSYIDPIVDMKTRTATVRVVLDNPDGRYKPGRFVTGRIRVLEDDQVVSVPSDSVQLSGDRLCVFVRHEKGFELRHVTVGVSTPKDVEIREGLQAGDEVVIRGAFHLKAELAKQASGGVPGHGHAH